MTSIDDTPVTALVPGVYTPNQPGFVKPGSAAWLRCITPSKIAAIIGKSRWESPYSLWHRMKGLIDADEPKDIFAVGHAYEPAAAELWKLKNPGWRLSDTEVQYVLPVEALGFPALATLDRRAVNGRQRRVVEMKLARDLYDWGDDLTGDCPDDYAGQVIALLGFLLAAQAAGIESNKVKWLDTSHLIALGPFFNDHIYPVEFDERVWLWMLKKCRKFYSSLQQSTPPPLDDSTATYECLRKLHTDIDYETTVEVNPDLAWAIHDANDECKAAEARLQELKIRLIDQMGDARYAESNGAKVATRSPHYSGSVSLNLARKHPALHEGI